MKRRTFLAAALAAAFAPAEALPEPVRMLRFRRYEPDDLMDASPLFKGEIGVCENIRFIQSPMTAGRLAAAGLGVGFMERLTQRLLPRAPDPAILGVFRDVVDYGTGAYRVHIDSDDSRVVFEALKYPAMRKGPEGPEVTIP
jgi:hypothetical protein